MEIEEIKQNIQALRAELENKFLQCSEDRKPADKVISSSMELDELIVEYLKLVDSKFNNGP